MNKNVKNCEYLQALINETKRQYICEFEENNVDNLNYNKYLIKFIKDEEKISKKNIIELFINSIDLLFHLKFISLSNKSADIEDIQQDLININEGYKKSLKIYCNNDFYDRDWNNKDIYLLRNSLIEYLEIERK